MNLRLRFINIQHFYLINNQKKLGNKNNSSYLGIKEIMENHNEKF